MRFRMLRTLYSKTAPSCRIRPVEDYSGKYTGTAVVMSDADGNGEKIRAIFKGGDKDKLSNRSTPEFSEPEEDFMNAGFYTYAHMMLPLLVQAIDEADATTLLLTETLNHLIQRPHNETVRKEANEVLREVLAQKVIDERDFSQEENHGEENQG